MAYVKISQLPAASALTGAELVPLVQSGVTSQSTVSKVAAANTLANITALRASALATPTLVALTNNWNAGDGGGEFRYDSTDTTTADNSGTVIVDALSRRWKRQFDGVYRSNYFDIKFDGSTDDTAALHLLRDAAPVNGNVYLTGVGTTVVNNFLLNKAGQIWCAPKVTFKQKNGGTGASIRCQADGVWLQNFTCNGNRAGTGAGGGGISVEANDVRISDLYMYETGTYGVSSFSGAQRWNIERAKFRTCSINCIAFILPAASAADVDGGRITDVDIDLTGEQNLVLPLAAGIIVRGDETAPIRYYKNCYVSGVIIGIDNPIDSTAHCAEFRTIINMTWDLRTVNGAMGVSTDDLLGVCGGSLFCKGANAWGLEVGGSVNGIGHISVYGSIDVSDSSGTRRGLAGILHGNSANSNGILEWRGPIKGALTYGIYRLGSGRGLYVGDIDATSATYAIFAATPDWRHVGDIYGNTTTGYAVRLAGSTGQCSTSGRVSGVNTGIWEITASTAITVQEIESGYSCASVIPVFSATSLTGGAALGRNISSNVTTQFTANFLGTIQDFAANVIAATGTGTPEANLTAGVGSVCQRRDGGAATAFYVKETGTGNTGWVGK